MPRAAVAMAAGRGGDDGGDGPAALYAWLDSVPLSRPRRNLARDFSDGVLAAEVVKFFLPALVQLHGYVPACATAQKLSNWAQLNRKVLSKLKCCLPQDVIRQLVQGRPGAAEQVLLLLRSRIQERLRQSQDPGVPAARGGLSYMETGGSKAGGGSTQESPKAAGAQEQQAEQEKALLLAQETIQILQLKVSRLEQLLRLKDVRIQDLSRLLREAQRR
ncbi:sperm flagellar protein 1 [Pezoporus flaviventris]|uniref:sperm flagellar protein 1 n=1 Tax=Pezoporus flaviventris TaxID=889875 RepID=UPI002AB06B7C|nr:sperm flagellar protein 1 [Pezoporus flaviventris]